jgi:hypothetical protein
MSTFLDQEESEKAVAAVSRSDAFRIVMRGSAIVEDQLKKAVDAPFAAVLLMALKGFVFRLSSSLPRRSALSHPR